MDSGRTRVVVGTRGSRLARRQTDLVVEQIQAVVPHVELVVRTISTLGDRVVDRPISELGDKGVFVRAIEQALLDGEIDLAVHSLKDLTSEHETPGLEIAAFSARADPRDVLISRNDVSLADLPPGSIVGTSSMRRRIQLGALHSNVRVVDIRGNVDTRIQKLDVGHYDAIILAAAGLHRLGLAERISEYLAIEDFTPDAGQGIMAIQTRSGDEAAYIARQVDVPQSRLAATAERAVVRALGADCHSPVGAFATIQAQHIEIRGMAATEDGKRMYRDQRDGPAEQAEEIGLRLGAALLRALDL